MTDLSDSKSLVYKAKHKIRFVTAASLFDGHDASISIMRRILQGSGAEVIHLGHNRSVGEIVDAALQEDVQGIAISSYQGGHLEYFKYMVELLKERGGAHIQVFGGGGGVIVPAEIKELEGNGVARIYSPEDGQRMGLQGMINDMLARCDFDLVQYAPQALEPGNARSLAQVITAIELGAFTGKLAAKPAVVLGVTGTGGAGKSSLTDELVRRFRLDQGADLGVASQLEKIDMLDFADFVAINKFDRKGAEDALRDVRKQVQRNREAFRATPDSMPVFGTIAARFNDDGVTALYHAIADKLADKGLRLKERCLPRPEGKASSNVHVIIPAKRQRYLGDIAETLRGYHLHIAAQSQAARERQQVLATQAMLDKPLAAVGKLAEEKEAALDAEAKKLIDTWPKTLKAYSGDEQAVKVRGKELKTRLNSTSLSGTKVPKVALPKFDDHGAPLRLRMRQKLAGELPFNAGLFHFKRENEDPTRMFAGEGDPFRTNKRFHLLSKDMPAKRLSTAFDSVTLYGFDPDERPDIYGKVGNSGVSIATLEDMKVLYRGFDLCAPETSVSMTINGPAPTLLAMFFNTAIDQQVEGFFKKNSRQPNEEELESIKKETLASVRGTVQADILKEDQGQNTCIFSTEFSLKVMGDIQQYFIENNVRNFYSVSISGYHI